MKHLLILILASSVISLISCKKEDPAPVVNKREVRYEVSGNFSGQLSFIYSNTTFGFNTIEYSSFPQTVNITYPDNISACTAGGTSSGLLAGVSGQTLTLKIYSGGTLAHTIEAVANASGAIEFPSWGAHLF